MEEEENVELGSLKDAPFKVWVKCLICLIIIIGGIAGLIFNTCETLFSMALGAVIVWAID